LVLNMKKSLEKTIMSKVGESEGRLQKDIANLQNVINEFAMLEGDEDFPFDSAERHHADYEGANLKRGDLVRLSSNEDKLSIHSSGVK